MNNLEHHHLLRLQRFANAAQQGEDVSILSEDMMASLGPLLTEARLDAAMKEAKEGKYKDRDFPGELLVADAIVAEKKAKEEADAKAKEEAILKDTQDVMGLSAVISEPEVDAAVATAEGTATEDEKKTGFWSRVGGFFKGLFVSKKEEEKTP